MVRSFIQMMSLILTLGASMFLLKSNLGLTPQTVAGLSSTGFGYSKAVVEALSQQTADTGVGAFMLLLAFLLQLVNSLWPKSWKDLGVSWRGVVLAIVVSAAILTLAYFYSERVHPNVA